MKQLENKVALITGAGSGMGQTHAKVFAERGAAVVINDINGDGLLNVLDVVSMINIILLEDCPIEADMNSDTFCNVLDIVQLVNIILSS